jgi:hypothetical protein
VGIPPIFLIKPINFEIQMGDEIFYEHELPLFVDINQGDTVTLSLEKADSWVELEQEGNPAHLIFKTDEMRPGDYGLKIVVFDQTGLLSNYEVKYRVLDRPIEIIDEKIEEILEIIEEVVEIEEVIITKSVKVTIIPETLEEEEEMRNMNPGPIVIKPVIKNRKVHTEEDW